MTTPILHTPSGNHTGLAAILLAEKVGFEMDLRILQVVNLKEKIYKWGSGIFP